MENKNNKPRNFAVADKSGRVAYACRTLRQAKALAKLHPDFRAVYSPLPLPLDAAKHWADGQPFTLSR